MTDPDPIVSLNVGGKLFQARQSTLIRGSGYFHALFKGGFAEARVKGLDETEEEGDGQPEEAKQEQKLPAPTVFLDLDPDVFRLALSKMRYPELEFPQVPPKTLKPTLEFLGMDWEPILPPLPPPPLLSLLRNGDRMHGLYGDTWYLATYQGYNVGKRSFGYHCDEDRPGLILWRDFNSNPSSHFQLIPDHPSNAQILARDPDLEILKLLTVYAK